MPSIEMFSGLDLCGKDRTRLQAFNDSSVCSLLHFGLSAPEEKTQTYIEKFSEIRGMLIID